MSYWFRRRERYHRPASNVCPSRWMVSPPKHVLRGWPTCYDGGTDTSAGRTPLGWRYTCLLGGRTTTAVLIHTSAGRTPLGWRYTYTCLLVGHTCYDGDTSAGRTTPLGWRSLTIHLHLPLGRTYMLRRRYISWADNTTWYTTHTIYIYGANITSAALHVHFLPGRTSRLDIHCLLGGDTFHGGPACLVGQHIGRLCNLYGVVRRTESSKAT